jgi:hypothetical protein
MLSKDFKKLHKWYITAQRAIQEAGGGPWAIELFPPDLIELLVRNDIELIYTGKRRDAERG